MGNVGVGPMTVHLGEGSPDGKASASVQRQKPGTPSLLRELNDRAALELLLADGPLTRAQLSERTGVSKVTVSQMLARLEERGLVMIAGEQAGGRGPNAALYSVVRSSAYVAGLYVDRQRRGPGRGGAAERGRERQQGPQAACGERAWQACRRSHSRTSILAMDR